MAEKYKLPSESDEDDEDYIPEGQESVSEAEFEVDTEIVLDDYLKNKKETDVCKVRKRKKMQNKAVIKHRKCEEKASLKKTAEREFVEDGSSTMKFCSEEEEKKRADSLWADFMKDATVVSKSKSRNSSANHFSEKPDYSLTKPKVEDKVKIKKMFEFAGETIEVEKEVFADSAEARISVSTSKNFTKNVNVSSTFEKREPKQDRGARKVGLGGISSVLGQLGKKAKITTLEKSKMDWDNFKKQENIEEEIHTHNKGKDGYLEKQDFLQRADFRQFEIEKQLRNTSRRSSR